MSSEHTPGPWRVVNRHYYFAIYTGPIGQNPVGCQIADTNHENAGNQEANARRIVACVNACEGISTEDLERYPGMPHGAIMLTAERDQLRSHNAELVKVIEAYLRTAQPDKHRRGIPDLADVDAMARALIAKAKP